jgi:hypothetical protein
MILKLYEFRSNQCQLSIVSMSFTPSTAISLQGVSTKILTDRWFCLPRLLPANLAVQQTHSDHAQDLSIMWKYREYCLCVCVMFFVFVFGERPTVHAKQDLKHQLCSVRKNKDSKCKTFCVGTLPNSNHTLPTSVAFYMPSVQLPH